MKKREREFRLKNPRVGPTRIVRFVSGRYERGWVKNVVAVGNASGFVEPLEATALGAIAQQSRVLADSLLAADRQPRPSQRDMFNRFHALSWDAIRGFLAVHYKFNTRLETPFWRHCREATDLAGAAEIAHYYAENGPDAFWGETLLQNPHDSIRISGYITMMTGMSVPYRKTYHPSETEWALLKVRQRKYKDLALERPNGAAVPGIHPLVAMEVVKKVRAATQGLLQRAGCDVAVSGSGPSTPQGLIKCDQISPNQSVALNKLVFGDCQGALGIDDVEKITRASLIERGRQFNRPAAFINRFLQKLAARLLFTVRGQRIVHVFQRGQDGGLIFE